MQKKNTLKLKQAVASNKHDHAFCNAICENMEVLTRAELKIESSFLQEFNFPTYCKEKKQLKHLFFPFKDTDYKNRCVGAG